MKRALLFILICLALLGTACSGVKEVAEPTPIPPTATEKPVEVFHTIKVNAHPAEGGAVAPWEERVVAGTLVKVQAKPAPGYEFTGWSGADSSTSPDLTITMDGDKQLTAHFNKLETATPTEPTMTPTPEFSPTPEVEPTSENPWLLTPWCAEHVGCEKLEVKNQTDQWANVYLKFRDTGVSKYFSIAPRTVGWITLRPGYYSYVFTICGGSKVFEGTHGLNQHWYVIFKQKWCP